MPAACLHSHSTSELLCGSPVAPEKSILSSPTRKKLRRKSSPKRVRMDCKVYLKHTWVMRYDEGRDTEERKLGSFNTIQVSIKPIMKSLINEKLTDFI